MSYIQSGDNLSPCSCGGKAIISWTSGRGGQWWTIFCERCMKETTRTHDKQEAAKRWSKSLKGKNK